jgi:ribosomal protein L37AE/L43A
LSKDEKRKMIIESIVEGRKMEAYAEHRAKDMHVCSLCDKILYRRTPMKKVGEKWVCIDCLRQLKEILDTLEQWEQEISLEKEMKKQLDDGIGP